MSLAPGDSLGHYTILAPIGAGGMGEVYRARDARLDRDVAVKVLPQPVADDPARLARFEREARAVARLSHPNILDVHELGEYEGRLFMVTEVLEGETLRHRLRGQGLPWQKVVEVGRGIADGLAAAHRKGIVHRDLKPENIFLTSDGRVKVLDFGLARVTHEVRPEGETATLEPDGTRPGAIMGTPGYMAPEQVRGRPADHRSDIFALGCVLYEMISGRRAFGGESSPDVMAAILREDPAQLAATGRALPRQLERIVFRCLEKSPEARFQSAADLAHSLKSLTTGRSVFLPRKVVIPALLAATVIAAVAVWRLLPPTTADSGQPSEKSIAVLPFQNISPETEPVDWFVQGVREDVAERLVNVSALLVRPLETVSKVYGNGDKGLSEVASELRVGSLLVGSVRVIGNRFRLSVRLVDSRGENTLWQESYEGDYTTGPDMFDTQSDIAGRIASALGTETTAQERALMDRRPTDSMKAWNLYRQGRYQQSKITPESLHKAVDLYNQAIEEDPGFGQPYAAIAQAYTGIAQYERWTPADYATRVTAAAKRALEVDDTLGEPYSILGEVKYATFDFFGAERNYRKALHLEPNSIEVLCGYAQFLNVVGRYEEALSLLDRAREIDPVNPLLAGNLVALYINARRYDEALDAFHEALELDPQHMVNHWMGGMAYSYSGQQDKAIAELKLALKLGGGAIDPLPFLGCAYVRAGRRSEAEKVLGRLQELADREYVPPSAFAQLSACLGEPDLAFNWLEQSYRKRDGLLLWVLCTPAVDTLRSDPRFDALMEKIGLTEYRAAVNVSPPQS